MVGVLILSGLGDNRLIAREDGEKLRSLRQKGAYGDKPVTIIVDMDVRSSLAA